MCYVFKEGKVKRVGVPVVKGKLVQTEDMRVYLKTLREKYRNRNWDKEVRAKIPLKPARV